MPAITYQWAPNPLIIADEFVAAAGRLADIAVPLEEIRFFLMGDIERNFDKQRDPDGEPWMPLDPEYKRRKIAKGGGNKILIWTDEMHQAAINPENYPIEAGAGMATLSAGMWNLPPYAIYHQEGRGDRSTWGALGEAKARYRAGAYDRAEYKEVISAIGTTGRGSNLPQRAFLGVSAGAQAAIDQEFNTWLEEVLESSLTTAEHIGFSSAGQGPIVGRTQSGQPIIRIPGVGTRFARK